MNLQQTRNHPNPPLECYLSVSSHPFENGFKRIKLLRTSFIQFHEDQFWDSQIMLSCGLFAAPGKIDAQLSSTIKYWFLTSTKRSSSLGFPVVMQRIQSGFFSLLEMFLTQPKKQKVFSIGQVFQILRTKAVIIYAFPYYIFCRLFGTFIPADIRELFEA